MHSLDGVGVDDVFFGLGYVDVSVYWIFYFAPIVFGHELGLRFLLDNY